jgi:hypothetical protein
MEILKEEDSDGWWLPRQLSVVYLALVDIPPSRRCSTINLSPPFDPNSTKKNTPPPEYSEKGLHGIRH